VSEGSQFAAGGQSIVIQEAFCGRPGWMGGGGQACACGSWTRRAHNMCHE